jgi:hypothetical protein
MTSETFFENPFSSVNITPSRLLTFAADTLGRLNGDNPSGAFTALIAKLETHTQNVGNELGEVQSTLAVQKGKTQTVDQVIKEYKAFMKENEPFIAKPLGGRNKAAFKEFYPSGIEQHTKTTKGKIEAILKQVFDAADKHKTALGTVLSNELKAFTQAYKNARKEQVDQKGLVSDNRADKSANVEVLENTLLEALYIVGLANIGNPTKSSSYFNFSLLYKNGGSKKATKKVEEVKK